MRDGGTRRMRLRSWLAKWYRLRAYVSWLVSVPLAPVVLASLLVAIPAGRLVAARRRRRGLKPRIFWGTLALKLLKYNSAASRAAGYDSTIVILSSPPLSRREDYDLTPGAGLPGVFKPLFLRY